MTTRAREVAQYLRGVAEAYSKPGEYTCYPPPDRLTEAADIIEALLAEREWRSMDSAPRDGTEIILCVGETIPDHPYVCAATFIEHEEGETLGYWQGWLQWSQDGCDFNVLMEDEPTGWLPLPQPPEGEW